MKVISKIARSATVLVLSMAALNLEAKEQRVYIKMKEASVFKAITQAQVQSQQLQNIFPQINLRLVDSLNNLNAVVAKVDSEADVESLRKNPNVAFVQKEVFFPAPKALDGFMYSPLADGVKLAEAKQTPWGILAIRAVEAWALDGMGAKARVLVLDTGIDRGHPSLKPNFEEGRNFAGDEPVNSADFSDLVGHGTHVSGIIAGALDASGFSGVAPNAKLLMGRVCAIRGCSNIGIVQGINWGIQKKVDVINMSISTGALDPSIGDAVTSAYAAGVTIVSASGNGGAARVGFPAALKEVIAVGATDRNGQRASLSQYGPELTIVAPGMEVLSTFPQGRGIGSKVQMNINGDNMVDIPSAALHGSKIINRVMENQLAYVGRGSAEDFARVNVSGKFALITHGGIRIGDKVNFAIKAGATGIIFINNIPGLLRGNLKPDGGELPIPVLSIEQKNGDIAQKAIESGQVVKGKVFVEKADYEYLEGTSMASPHVAGVVALMKSANKTLSPARVKELLKKTATVVEQNVNNKYGSGIVNAEAAVKESMAQ
ncbi:MAG: S8 family serine peptidase [Bdellovibrionota bacterium]